MAIYCGVCATRLSSALENCGGFSVSNDFKGWNTNDSDESAAIRDTCDSCYNVLTKVITDAANKIVKKNMAMVEQLRKECQANREAARKAAKDKEDFERAWKARKNDK